MGLVKNLPQVERHLTFYAERYKRHSLAYFKMVLWELFVEILMETPQFSGKAVGNWNLSIGAPDYTFDANAGDEQSITKSGYLSKHNVLGRESGNKLGLHAKGDLTWVWYSMIKNRPKLDLVQLDSRAFITNAAVGDTDHGKSSELYLESLQDPGYWAVKLRAANKPYQTVAETIVLFNARKIDEGKVAPFL